MPVGRRSHKVKGVFECAQVKMWPCVYPDGAQQKFFAWAKTLAEQLGRKDILLLFAIPNSGKYRLPHLHSELALEGVKQECMDMFLPIPACGKHGLFYSFKATKDKESSRVPRRALARSLIKIGYGVIYTLDWKYAALKTSHYLSGTYEQDPVPEGNIS